MKIEDDAYNIRRQTRCCDIEKLRESARHIIPVGGRVGLFGTDLHDLLAEVNLSVRHTHFVFARFSVGLNFFHLSSFSWKDTFGTY
jgi:hypothetical protein